MREPRGRNAEIFVLAVLGLFAPLCHARATVTVTGTGDTVAVDPKRSRCGRRSASINNGANVQRADVVAVGTYGTNDTVAFSITGGCSTPCTITTVGFPPASQSR